MGYEGGYKQYVILHGARKRNQRTMSKMECGIKRIEDEDRESLGDYKRDEITRDSEVYSA